MQSLRIPIAAVVAAPGLALISEPAHAHEMIPGVSGFAALMLHPLIQLEIAACIVCGTLLVARSDKFQPIQFLVAIAAFIPTAYLLAEVGSNIPYLWSTTLVVALAASVACAALNKIDSKAAVYLLVALGVGIGMSTEPEIPTTRGTIEILAATILTTAILVVGVGSILRMVKFGWSDVLLRVAASWVAATTLMMVALLFQV
jgi:hypothetical protein